MPIRNADHQCSLWPPALEVFPALLQPGLPFLSVSLTPRGCYNLQPFWRTAPARGSKLPGPYPKGATGMAVYLLLGLRARFWQVVETEYERIGWKLPTCTREAPYGAESAEDGKRGTETRGQVTLYHHVQHDTQGNQGV